MTWRAISAIPYIVVCIAVRHPGSEDWPDSHFFGSAFTSRFLPGRTDESTAEHMTALVALQALQMQPGESAGPGPDASRAVDIAGRCRLLTAAVGRCKSKGLKPFDFSSSN